MKQNSLFSALLFICLAFSATQTNCSAPPQKKSYRSLIHKTLGVCIVAAAAAVIATNPLSATKENLPKNPMQHLNTVKTIDQECFGFSLHPESDQIAIVSDVFSPEDRNDAIAHVKKYIPEAKIHYYDCRYYDHRPYKN